MGNNDNGSTKSERKSDDSKANKKSDKTVKKAAKTSTNRGERFQSDGAPQCPCSVSDADRHKLRC